MSERIDNHRDSVFIEVIRSSEEVLEWLLLLPLKLWLILEVAASKGKEAHQAPLLNQRDVLVVEHRFLASGDALDSAIAGVYADRVE